MNIAVLLPLYRNYLSLDEEISFNLLRRHLSSYELVIIKPESLVTSFYAQKKISFPDHFFRSIPDYSKLLLTTHFYEALTEYDYVLIYQLDCLVFSNDWKVFCNMGFDYIGAPLFHRYNNNPKISRVGNGGLSLRRVSGFLDVLYSTKYVSENLSLIRDYLTTSIPDLNEWPYHQRWIKKMRILRAIRNGVSWYTNHYLVNEDLFWSDRARLFNPNFKIAPIDVALKFSFDKHPRVCYEKNNYQMPFGAHAWARWDRAFWEPFLRQ